MKDEPRGNDIEYLRAKPADIVERRFEDLSHILTIWLPDENREVDVPAYEVKRMLDAGVKLCIVGRP